MLLVTILNGVGIVLEIVGFVVLLFAIKPMPKGKSSFTSGFQNLPNVMSMTSPRTNKIGIGLVIIGLVLQLVSLAWNS